MKSNIVENNCIIIEIDLGRYKIYSAQYAIDTFGEDYLNEYGYRINDRFLEECLDAQAIADELNTNLSDLYNQRRNRDGNY